MNIAKVLKSNIISKMFDALDDEVLFCLDTELDISESSRETLEIAVKLGIGTSKALQKIENAN